MKFKFDVNTTDKDYLDYNTFWMIKSPYGKKQMKKFRIFLIAIFGIGVFALLLVNGFTASSFVSVISLVILALIFQLFMTRFFALSLKGQIKSLKKSGKMGYSPQSVIEFYDDKFTEETEDNKNEHKYTAIERISIVSNKMIYIHINNVMAYMLPLSCFESEKQYNSFIEFIKTKVANIDVY